MGRKRHNQLNQPAYQSVDLPLNKAIDQTANSHDGKILSGLIPNILNTF